MTRHVTLTLHTQNKMAASMNDLYLFGEDFEAILEILERDEDLEKQFESSVSDVSTNSENLYFCFGVEDNKIITWSAQARMLYKQPLVCVFKILIYLCFCVDCRFSRQSLYAATAEKNTSPVEATVATELLNTTINSSIEYEGAGAV